MTNRLLKNFHDFGKNTMSLNLSKQGYNDKNVFWITKILESYPNVKDLNLSNNNFSPLGISNILQCLAGKKVKSLNLASLNLDDYCLKHYILPCLHNIKSLQEIVLYPNNISAQLVKTTMHYVYLNHTILDISYAKLTDGHIKTNKLFIKYTNLQYLNMLYKQLNSYEHNVMHSILTNEMLFTNNQEESLQEITCLGENNQNENINEEI
jgi:hypothetical protein